MNHVYKTAPSHQHGFTLIELMLAMSGVAFLLLAIAMTTIQISQMYSKGLTLKSVNQVGRDFSDSLQRDIKASTPFDTASSSSFLETPYGGRLCLGQYSYVWNYGKTLAESDTTNTIMFDDGTKVRMARVLDTGGLVCVNADKKLPITRADASEILISSDKLDMALHSFTLTASALDPATHQGLYSVTFTLGTNNQDSLIMTGDASCKAPNDDDSDWEFCAINVFDFTTRAGNRT